MRNFFKISVNILKTVFILIFPFIILEGIINNKKLLIISLIILAGILIFKFYGKYKEHRNNYSKINDPEFLEVYNKLINNSTKPYIRIKFPFFEILSIIIINALIIKLITIIFEKSELLSFVVIDLILLFFEFGYVYNKYKKKEFAYNAKNGNKYNIYTVEDMAKCMGHNLIYKLYINYELSNGVGIKIRDSFPNEKFYRTQVDVAFKYLISDNVFANIYNFNFISLDDKNKEYISNSGLFCEVPLDFNVNYDMEVSINNIFNLDRVNMDDENFEKYFDIICDNKMQAMQVFTSDFMFKILDLYKNYTIPFKLKIKNNCIYILFYKKIFTFSAYYAKIKKEKVYEEYIFLKEVFELSNMFYDKLKEVC